MVATRVQFVSDISTDDCPACGADSREAVLVNQHGLVLARRQVCTSCGHRHRLHAQPELRSFAGALR
jgi:hypothetical protein